MVTNRRFNSLGLLNILKVSTDNFDQVLFTAS